MSHTSHHGTVCTLIPNKQYSVCACGAFQGLVTGRVLSLTFSVLEYPLDQDRVFGDPLSDQQNALWDTEPPHNAAAHYPLHEHKDTRQRTAADTLEL